MVAILATTSPFVAKLATIKTRLSPIGRNFDGRFRINPKSYNTVPHSLRKKLVGVLSEEEITLLKAIFRG